MTEFSDVPETIDFSGEFTDEKQLTAPEYPAEGFYHCKITSVDASGERYEGAIYIVLEVLAGTAPDQEGKLIYHVIFPPHPKAGTRGVEAWKKNVLRWMLAVGLRKPGEFPSAVPVKSQSWWEDQVDRTLICKVTHSEQKITDEVGNVRSFTKAAIARRSDMWPVGDPDVATVPLDQAFVTTDIDI